MFGLQNAFVIGGIPKDDATMPEHTFKIGSDLSWFVHIYAEQMQSDDFIFEEIPAANDVAGWRVPAGSGPTLDIHSKCFLPGNYDLSEGVDVYVEFIVLEDQSGQDVAFVLDMNVFKDDTNPNDINPLVSCIRVLPSRTGVHAYRAKSTAPYIPLNKLYTHDIKLYRTTDSWPNNVWVTGIIFNPPIDQFGYSEGEGVPM